MNLQVIQRHCEKAGLALRRQHHRRKYHRFDLDSARMCAHLRQQAPRVAHRRHGRYPGMSHHRHSVCRAHAHHEEILALAGRFNARRLRRLYRAQRHCYGITCNFCNESSVFKKNGAFLCTFQIISS